MIENIKLLIESGLEKVLKTSSLNLMLLSCYSKLYLDGGAPRWCEKSQRLYFIEIQKTGMMKAEKFLEAKNRKCTPKWTGKKFYPKTGLHINSLTITDSQAIEYLNSGVLMESDFYDFPEGYQQKTHKDIIVLDSEPKIEENKEVIEEKEIAKPVKKSNKKK